MEIIRLHNGVNVVTIMVEDYHLDLINAYGYRVSARYEKRNGRTYVNVLHKNKFVTSLKNFLYGTHERTFLKEDQYFDKALNSVVIDLLAGNIAYGNFEVAVIEDVITIVRSPKARYKNIQISAEEAMMNTEVILNPSRQHVVAQANKQRKSLYFGMTSDNKYKSFGKIFTSQKRSISAAFYSGNVSYQFLK